MSTDNSKLNGAASQGYPLIIGEGKNRPQGKRVILPPREGGIVSTYVHALNNVVTSSQESWYGLHLWDGDKRNREGWTSSWGVGIDFDWTDPHSTWFNPAKNKIDKHCPIPKEVVELLNEDARNKAMPSNAYHSTYRGIRFLFVFDKPVSRTPGLELDDQAAYYLKVGQGAVSLCQKYLREKGVYWEPDKAGLKIDTCFKDFARFYYGPKAYVDGVQRDGWFVELRKETFDDLYLAKLAGDYIPPPKEDEEEETPEPAKLEKKKKKRDEELPEEFYDAKTRFEADLKAKEGPFPQPGTGKCPVCQHSQCFGYLKDDPDKAFCFSANHTGAGTERDAGWVMSRLDIAMFKAGVIGEKTQAEFLADAKDDSGKPYYRPKDSSKWLFVASRNQWYRIKPNGDLADEPTKTEALKTLLGRSAGAVVKHAKKVETTKPIYNSDQRIVIEHGSTYYNIYRKPRLIAEPGEFPHIYEVFLNNCNNDEKAVHFKFGWYAYWIQSLILKGKPVMMRTALVNWGIKGSGKTCEGDLVTGILEPQNVGIINQEGLDSRFTDDLAHKVFVVANEVYGADRRDRATNKVKAWVTDPRIREERKGKDARAIYHHFNMLFTANKRRAVDPEGEDDRRYNVFRSDKPLDKKLAREVYDDLEGEKTELSHFYHHLLYLPAEKLTKPGELYDNQARQELIDDSKPSWVVFCDAVLEQGMKIICEPWQNEGKNRTNPEYFQPREAYLESKGVVYIPEDTLYEVYAHYCRRHGMGATKSRVFKKDFQAYMTKNLEGFKAGTQPYRFNGRRSYAGLPLNAEITAPLAKETEDELAKVGGNVLRGPGFQIAVDEGDAKNDKV